MTVTVSLMNPIYNEIEKKVYEDIQNYVFEPTVLTIRSNKRLDGSHKTWHLKKENVLEVMVEEQKVY
jgi:hypothetical protein